MVTVNWIINACQRTIDALYPVSGPNSSFHSGWVLPAHFFVEHSQPAIPFTMECAACRLPPPEPLAGAGYRLRRRCS